MGHRPWILTLVLVTCAFVAGLVAGDRRSRVVSPPAPTLPVEAKSPATDAAVPAARLAAPLAAGPRVRPEGGVSGATASPAVAQEAALRNVVVLDGLHPASIRVLVVDADGAPVEGATAYAIHEGVHGAPEDAATVQTDALGRATIRVPVEGRYFVTVRSEAVAAVNEGVEATAKGEGEVVVTLARTAALQVSVRGVPAGAPWKAVATARLTRSDGSSAGADLFTSASGDSDSLALRVPENVPFSLGVFPDWSDPRWQGLTPAAAWPRIVSAPGAYVAEFRQGGTREGRPRAVKVDVEVALEAESSALPPSGRVAIQFRERVGDSAPGDFDDAVVWGPEDSTRSTHHLTEAWPPRIPGRVEWTVAGSTGSVVVPATPAGETLTFKATARISPSAVTTGVAAVEVLDEDGRPVPVGGPPTACAELFTADDDLGVTGEESAASMVRDWLRGRAGQPVVAVRGPWRVSPPATAAEGETLRLRLELGGYLLVHVRKPLPRGVGALVVQRTDGAWLGAYASEAELPGPTESPDEYYPESAGPVRNGTLVGPLPPGDVGLRFLVGGVEVGRSTGHVVSGEVAVLTIR